MAFRTAWLSDAWAIAAGMPAIRIAGQEGLHGVCPSGFGFWFEAEAASAVVLPMPELPPVTATALPAKRPSGEKTGCRSLRIAAAPEGRSRAPRPSPAGAASDAVICRDARKMAEGASQGKGRALPFQADPRLLLLATPC